MIIVGVDEAGRGCLAGNVVAAAVILPKNAVFSGLTDSKKISVNKRHQLYKQITQQCIVSVGYSSAAEIDQLNILNATLLAMKRAIDGLGVSFDKVLIDGNHAPDVNHCQTIVGGDLLVPVISAASVVAKVSRDNEMLLLDKKYPNYGFKQHKSYATKAHLAAIDQFGVIKGVHRLSFKPIQQRLF